MTFKKSETFARYSSTHFKLWKKVEIVHYFNQLLQDYLEPTWKPHCRVVNFREQILVIAVSNGALATQLRFQAQTILSFLTRHQIEFQKIDVIVDNSFWKTEEKHLEKLELSHQSKTIFESVAKNLKNERLKKAIEKFVK